MVARVMTIASYSSYSSFGSGQLRTGGTKGKTSCPQQLAGPRTNQGRRLAAN